MAPNALPTSLYESLLLKLITILELTQKAEGTSTPQAKQALLHATNDFKNALSQAKELAVNLPGGDLLVVDQDDVIQMLQTLRDRKQEQLAQFSTASLTTSNMRMAVDSMASTPYEA